MRLGSPVESGLQWCVALLARGGRTPKMTCTDLHLAYWCEAKGHTRQRWHYMMRYRLWWWPWFTDIHTPWHFHIHSWFLQILIVNKVNKNLMLVGLKKRKRSDSYIKPSSNLIGDMGCIIIKYPALTSLPQPFISFRSWCGVCEKKMKHKAWYTYTTYMLKS